MAVILLLVSVLRAFDINKSPNSTNDAHAAGLACGLSSVARGREPYYVTVNRCQCMVDGSRGADSYTVDTEPAFIMSFSTAEIVVLQ
jgi:hypothetical protein